MKAKFNLSETNSNSEKSLEFSEDDIHLIRQWFDVVQDIHPNYLEQADYLLAKKIYQSIDMRVTNSIERNC
ncbi:MAG: hypothetical protein RIE86_09355 [Imperialibacter sp.]|uniref:hypothetical protein n=1 Tax=Imperialibacter sp. TaxID=2038411 RepID=UPI0032EAE843